MPSVRILYIQRSVYFGAERADSRAHEVVATGLRRDVTQSLDDFFEIAIDSARSPI